MSDNDKDFHNDANTDEQNQAQAEASEDIQDLEPKKDVKGGKIFQ